MIFFTADHHFGHKNIIAYCNRPFSSVREMNETMIERWNERVKEKDTVWHLGDIGLIGYTELNKILDRLNGNISLIQGTHDRVAVSKYCKDRFVRIEKLHTIKVNGIKITLCHYKMWTWESQHYGSWHLYGHSHGNAPRHGNSLDVGVDNFDFYPVSFEEIKSILGAAQNPAGPEAGSGVRIGLIKYN